MGSEDSAIGRIDPEGGDGSKRPFFANGFGNLRAGEPGSAGQHLVAVPSDEADVLP